MEMNNTVIENTNNIDNLSLYNKFREVPAEAKKKIEAGNLKGYSDINPVWRIKKLTEEFGPCGIGWYSEIVENWKEEGANDEVIYFVKLKLYIKYNGEWSMPIEGTGGSMLINAFSRGAKSNDEALKMAETDALSVACKKLGIGADVYFEKDRTKYDNVDTAKNTNSSKKVTSTKSTTTTTNNNNNASESDLEVLTKVKRILWEVSEKNKEKSIELLEKHTSFKGRDGNIVAGLTDFTKLSGKRLLATYGKLQKEYPDIYKKVKEEMAKKKAS
jgi:hypothetical protein